MEYAHASSRVRDRKTKETVGCQLMRLQSVLKKNNQSIPKKMKTAIKSSEKKQKLKAHQKRCRDKSSTRDKKKKDKSGKKSHRDDRF